MATPDAQQAQAPKQAQTPVAPAADVQAPSKTKQAVAGLDGHAAQEAALVPPENKAPAPGASAAKDAKDGAPAKGDEPKADQKTEEMAGPEKLSPLREAVLQQFQILEGKGIGDEEFEAVCGKDWWEKRKLNEAEAKRYNKEDLPKEIAKWEAACAADPNYAKANPKPTRKDDSVFTTCIATQGKILEAAFKALGYHTKSDGKAKWDLFGYATMGRIEAGKRGAWVEAKPGMSERPQKGDVLVLEMRGAPDKVQKDIDGENSEYGSFGQSQKKLEKEIAKLQQASMSATDAISKAASAKLPEVQAKLAELRQKHEAKIAELNVKLDAARKETQAKAGTEKETKGGRMGGLDFSHVGMFNGMHPEVGPDGMPTGREIWTTFDGGQNVPGKIDSQGAKSCTRLYDPKVNEIGSAKAGKDGVMTQDGKTRWLGGWANIDALVDPSKTGKK